MATKPESAGPINVPLKAPTPAMVELPHGNPQRWRERSAERKRRRLVSARHRRALAHGLRRTAALKQPPSRFDVCVILLDRVAPLRPQLLQIAAALEQTRNPDPTSVALIHELLKDGCGPLYNPSAPAADLYDVLRRAHAGLAAQPPA
jgi:hypothetical protein